MTSAFTQETTALGIDVGTSEVRVAIVDLAGQILDSAGRPVDVYRPSRSFAEAAPDQWWRAIIEATNNLDPQLRRRVGAMGLSTIFPALIAVDESGTPLSRAILYSDRRASFDLLDIKTRCSREDFIARSGNRPDSGCAGALNILWWQKHDPELYSRAAMFLPPNAYLTLKLSGRAVTDPTQACLMGLFDTRGVTGWDITLCEAFGLSNHYLPCIVGSAAEGGKLTVESAGLLGLRSGISVAPGAGDTVAGAIGSGLVDSANMLVVCGSTDTVVSLCSTPDFDGSMIVTPYPLGRHWLHLAAMSSTGVSFKWATNILGLKDVDELFALAAQAPPLAGGVQFLPYLQGERTGIWNEKASGVLVGLTAETQRKHIARAVIEGVAMALAVNVRMLEKKCGISLGGITVTGGGVRSGLSCQIRCDAAGVPLRRNIQTEMCTTGAAWLGARAAKMTQSAVPPKSQQSSEKLFTPDKSIHSLFERRAKIFKSLYESNVSIMHSLAEEHVELQ